MPARNDSEVESLQACAGADHCAGLGDGDSSAIFEVVNPIP
jgi:hypothetical protein